MKKKLIFSLILHLICFGICAQKKKIDNNSYKDWDKLSKYAISNDGNYVWFENESDVSGPILNIIFLKDEYKIRMPIANEYPVFSNDSKYLVFKGKNELNIFNLVKKKNQQIKNVTSFKMPLKGGNQWLAYSQDENLILRNLTTEEEKKYAEVVNYYYNVQGSVLLLQLKKGLIWISLTDMSEKLIAKDASYNNLTFDNSGTQIAYITFTENHFELRYYEAGNGMNEVYSPIEKYDSILSGELEIAKDLVSFSKNGNNVFFKVQKKTSGSGSLNTKDLITKNIDIWHYQDEYLQPEQLEIKSFINIPSFTAVLSIKQHKAKLLETDNNRLIAVPNEKFALTGNEVNDQEIYWTNALVKYNLTSIESGERKEILEIPGKRLSIGISPAEKFILWYNLDSSAYFAYEIATGITRNISKLIKEPLSADLDRGELFPEGVAGWINNDNALLIYDRFDIWKLDPLANISPVNITRFKGRNNNLSFRLAMNVDELLSTTPLDTLLLACFNLKTKENGFWKLPLNQDEMPIMCSMASSLYYFPRLFVGAPIEPPLKARDAKGYLVVSQNATLAPNLFFTYDFKKFKQISFITPQSNYNWMTSELLHWKMMNGELGTGILYKPENFDPQKKYPIIFHYYERYSNELNQFYDPLLSTGGINIPWYVSNEFLVFIPDIKPQIGTIGANAVLTVVSAANFLKNYYWIDSARMGLQGHSYGGYETNYIITQTNLFSAAQSSAGISNLISEYGGLGFGGRSLTFMTEAGQLNLGTTPWDSPAVYIRNSPLFYVNNVNTPLLLMHNQKDNAVDFSQSVQMFIALRRLRKPVWLLQYDGEGHAVLSTANKLDFNIRQQQFFNYYLKKDPAPQWLIHGIAAQNKGLISGLSTDSNMSGSKSDNKPIKSK